jgi:hypothetical protein
VVLVEIIAYSDENAYTIFETMNDRGIKSHAYGNAEGFYFIPFSKRSDKAEANQLWKRSMQELHEYAKDEDQRFVQAWFRGQYADTIRPGRAGSKNEDFEKIGTRFHSWFRDNLSKAGIKDDRPESFEGFIDTEFKFFLKVYKRILDAERNFNDDLDHLYYINRWGIANSLSYPLLLSPLKTDDPDSVINQKLNLVSRFIETFVVRRSVNFRKFASSSIRYTMYTLVKEIRRKDTHELRDILRSKLEEMEEKLDGIESFRLHGQNGRFVKFLLSRMTAFVEQKAGINSSFEKYYQNKNGKPYEIEHIWADKFVNHRDEFEQETEFQEFRNRLGGLFCCQGERISPSVRNLMVRNCHIIQGKPVSSIICELTYENNPNFLNMKGNLICHLKPILILKRWIFRNGKNYIRQYVSGSGAWIHLMVNK